MMRKKRRGRYAMVRGEKGGGGEGEEGKGEGWGEKDEEMRGRNGEEGCISAYWERTEEE